MDAWITDHWYRVAMRVESSHCTRHGRSLLQQDNELYPADPRVAQWFDQWPK